jgi:hypothetical protein
VRTIVLVKGQSAAELQATLSLIAGRRQLPVVTISRAA